MAKMYPDVDQTRVIFASGAEEKFYNECKRQLDDNWAVYSSCTLSMIEQNRGMKDNEIDFALYHPNFGLIVVEVKGGRLKFDPDKGNFYSINRYDEAFKIKDPFKQVLLWKSRFLRYLRQQSVRVPVCHAVCFPNVLETDIPENAAIEPKLVIGINRMENLVETLETIAKNSHEERFLNFNDVADRVHSILRGSHFSTRLHIRDYLDNHELRLKDIETISETLITPIASSPRLGIEGEAGTGKTMLAIMLAKYFRNLGKRVLMLSSNRLMNDYLLEQIGQGVDVKTYGQMAAKFNVRLHKAPQDFTGTHEEWIQFGVPERLNEAINNSNKRYDVLLCDESQDVQPFWWEAIETLLEKQTDPLDPSRFYIFFDRSQGVFGSGGKETHFVPENVLPIDPPWFPLVHNYRTTREISSFSRSFRTGKQILQSHSGRFGYKPEIIEYEDQADFNRQMKVLCRKLIEEEGIRTNEMTILSARAPFSEGSTLNEIKSIGSYGLFDMGKLKQRTGKRKKLAPQKGQIAVSTIESFKGMETPIAIVTNISEHKMPLDNPIMMSLLYVACTRAKHMLYIAIKKSSSKQQELAKALENVSETGPMVLEGSSADYQYTGTVTHYNPERVGWLKVDDPAFEKAGIMFFPADCESANLQIKIGSKIRFRPAVEGTITFASNLQQDG
ncbi:MAG: NERD domain-containing protein [Gammaproteobacteria bacterium]|nr:NERD domain-containing protein [Gammaproteobacteria bacterium]